MVEHIVHIDGVTGSSPVATTTNSSVERLRSSSLSKKVTHSGDFFGIIETGDKDAEKRGRAAESDRNGVSGYAGTGGSFAAENR